MAKKRSSITTTRIESVRHKNKRKNIPTEELRGFVQEDEQCPKQVAYPGLLYARDPSLDPQLVWRGKDEQDREPLTVPAVPIYIQEKIHPQVIIEDIRRNPPSPGPSPRAGRGAGVGLQGTALGTPPPGPSPQVGRGAGVGLQGTALGTPPPGPSPQVGRGAGVGLQGTALGTPPPGPSPQVGRGAGVGLNGEQMSLFADFNGIAFEEMIEFYRHEANWSNRMILGDSLLVMTSLAEKEGLKGKVQTIYIDPPYGIKFGSNWQVSTRKRDVKDGKAEDATRQPEQIRAFRDTWELGIHSYLSYWRDRLIVARELLTESGSVFVQIGDENVHLLRNILDEVFGSENFVCQIFFRKKLMPLGAKTLETMGDYLLWYAKQIDQAKYRQLYLPSQPDPSARWTGLELEDGTRRPLSTEERRDISSIPKGSHVYSTVSQAAPSFSSTSVFPFRFKGKDYVPPQGQCWLTSAENMRRLEYANRLEVEGDLPRYVMLHDDFPLKKITNPWTDTAPSQNNVYVVQTNTAVIERCLLMTTDPGDLVLDPTCFRAGTRVKTESGWKPIETVRPGERVWTHRGRLRHVVGVQVRPHVGPMVGLRVLGVEAAVWMTPEHRLLAPPSIPPHAWGGTQGGEETRTPQTPPPAPSPSDGEGNGERTPHAGQTAPPLAPPQTWGGERGFGDEETVGSAPPLAPPHRMGRGWGEVHATLGGKPGHAKVQFARTLRHEATDAEDLLWEQLRGRRLGGSKFRRQHPLGPHYIADFYCPEARLAVELDGSIHAVDRKRWGDGLRHGQMQMLAGVRVLRFENQRVIGDMEGVLREIAEHLTPPLHLSPSHGEGPGGGETHAGKAQPLPVPLPSNGEGPGVGPSDVLPESPALAPLPTRGEGPGVGSLLQHQRTIWREVQTFGPGDLIVVNERGETAEIEAVEHEHGEESVYDLTVEEDHSFVTEVAVAHNCGSGTTAFVAEQWGRRWITIDTSRVAIALARTRLMAAKFPYYYLASGYPQISQMNADAEIKEYLRKSAPSADNDIRKGFVYRRVPHVTLKSIANNPDIKEGMSRAEIDRAIARHADTELLYDQPYEDGKRIRVTGPFTVESLSPHRTISVEEKKRLAEVGIEGASVKMMTQAPQFTHAIIENLKKSGVQNTIKNERLKFDRLDVYAGLWINAAGEYTEKDGKTRRVAVCIGPEHGTVGPELVREAAKEAVKGVGFDLLLVCGFAFDPHVNEEAKHYGKLVVLPTRINADLQMGDEFLKKTGAGNLFMVFGEPDIEITKGKDGKLVVEIKGLDIYDPTTGEIRNNSTNDIACWFIDTNYNGESFFVRHAYFSGADRPYDRLKRALRAEINEEAWSALYSTRSRSFDAPATGKIAIKVINHYGDEVLKLYDCKSAKP